MMVMQQFVGWNFMRIVQRANFLFTPLSMILTAVVTGDGSGGDKMWFIS